MPERARRWSDATAEDRLVGKRIVGVRAMQEDELRRQQLPAAELRRLAGAGVPVLELDDGTTLYPSCEDAGLFLAGSLRAVPPRGQGREVGVRPGSAAAAAGAAAEVPEVQAQTARPRAAQPQAADRPLQLPYLAVSSRKLTVRQTAALDSQFLGVLEADSRVRLVRRDTTTAAGLREGTVKTVQRLYFERAGETELKPRRGWVSDEGVPPAFTAVAGAGHAANSSSLGDADELRAAERVGQRPSLLLEPEPEPPMPSAAIGAAIGAIPTVTLIPGDYAAAVQRAERAQRQGSLFTTTDAELDFALQEGEPEPEPEAMPEPELDSDEWDSEKEAAEAEDEFELDDEDASELALDLQHSMVPDTAEETRRHIMGSFHERLQGGPTAADAARAGPPRQRRSAH